MKWPAREQWLFLVNLLLQPLFASSPRKGIRSVLIVKWDEIGDMAACTHVFRHLKTACPDAQLTLLCKPFVKDLICNDPHIDEIILSEKQWGKSFDMVVELRGTWITLLKSLRYPPKVRVTRARVRWENRGKQKHETETNFDIIKPLLAPGTKSFAPQLYFSEADRQKVQEFLGINKVNGPYAVFHTGARRKLRQWPVERFAALAGYVHEKYGLHIVFIGAGKELETVGKLRSQLKFNTSVFPEEAGLAALSCLCAGAAFYSGNESGPLQIADTFGIPSLSMFGPGVPNVFYPRHESSVVLHHVLSCNPCDQVHCVRPDDPCINLIGTDEAFAAADRILGP